MPARPVHLALRRPGHPPDRRLSGRAARALDAGSYGATILCFLFQTWVVLGRPPVLRRTRQHSERMHSLVGAVDLEASNGRQIDPFLHPEYHAPYHRKMDGH